MILEGELGYTVLPAEIHNNVSLIVIGIRSTREGRREEATHQGRRRQCIRMDCMCLPDDFEALCT